MKKYITIVVSALVAVTASYFCLQSCIENTGMGSEAEVRAEMTPALLDSIRSIGEWQLMTVPLTMQVDTTQKRWLGLMEEKLQRSYTGTLSLGINMKQVPEEWSYIDEDTITLIVPDVCLLDTNFIDESKTRLIVSDNDNLEADPKVKGIMLRKARKLMIHAGVNKANLQNCRTEAQKELSRHFKAIGYKDVRVEFK